MTSDAIVGLFGAVVGAAIAGSVQFITSRIEQRDRYRLAALDRRLKAHQEAFSHWCTLVANAHKRDSIGDVVNECQSWWNNNCLYLDEDARMAFRQAYICASSHKDFVEYRSNRRLVEENWARIIAAGEALTKAVALPPVAELADENKG